MLDKPLNNDDNSRHNLNYAVTATASDDIDGGDINDKRRYQRNIEDIGTANDEETDEFEYFISAASLKITPKIFMQLCPALLLQIDEGVCHEVSRSPLKGDDHHKRNDTKNEYGKGCFNGIELKLYLIAISNSFQPGYLHLFVF